MIFQDTPNPNAKKVVMDHSYDVSIYLSEKEVSVNSDLKFFLDHKGIKNIFTGPSFITLTKNDDHDWEDIIKEFNNYS